MKIMAGMGSIDDYPAYVEAGADEIFIGYVPFSWVQKYGNRTSLNRREVLYYNVQIGSFSELLILKDMVGRYQLPVTITFNSLHYPKESYEDILVIMHQCLDAGFHRFIIADAGLLDFIYEKYKESIPFQISISGEYGEMNEEIIRSFAEKKIERIIFPRQTAISEMKEMIAAGPEMDYEAFILNEKCHFTGAYCNSMHCDEICHICKVPYRVNRDIEEKKDETFTLAEEENLPGRTGCGLCALWQLREAGVTHVKLVSRGNATEDTIQDIHLLKKAIEIMERARDEESYIGEMKKNIFPHGCSGNCYYILN